MVKNSIIITKNNVSKLSPKDIVSCPKGKVVILEVNSLLGTIKFVNEESFISIDDNLNGEGAVSCKDMFSFVNCILIGTI